MLSYLDCMAMHRDLFVWKMSLKCSLITTRFQFYKTLKVFTDKSGFYVEV